MKADILFINYPVGICSLIGISQSVSSCRSGNLPTITTYVRNGKIEWKSEAVSTNSLKLILPREKIINCNSHKNECNLCMTAQNKNKSKGKQK